MHVWMFETDCDFEVADEVEVSGGKMVVPVYYVEAAVVEISGLWVKDYGEGPGFVEDWP